MESKETWIQDLIRDDKLKDVMCVSKTVGIRTMGSFDSKERPDTTVEQLFSSTPHHDASEPDAPIRPQSRETRSSAGYRTNQTSMSEPWSGQAI
jgi:hypothetical protein